MAVTKIIKFSAVGTEFDTEAEALKADARDQAEARLATLLSTNQADSRIQDVLDALETDAIGGGNLGAILADFATQSEQVG